MMDNPFFLAFSHSDFLGKLIFFFLIATSIICWITLIYKCWLTREARKHSTVFQKVVFKQKNPLLEIENEKSYKAMNPNPFYELYVVLKKHTVDLLNKNHKFGVKEGDSAYLTDADIDFIESHLLVNIASHTKNLEKYLYLLSTIVGLAPLLGLLGTVWGILITFTDLQSHAMGSSNQAMLGGLSLALTTTVLGLLIAIPALIAFNYLKNSIRDFETEMEGFSTLILSSVEMQYRKV